MRRTPSRPALTWARIARTLARGGLALALTLLALGPAACGSGDGVEEGSVGGSNREPVLQTIHHQVFEVGVPHAPVIVTATDPDNDRLTYTLQGTLWVGQSDAQAFGWSSAGDQLPSGMSFSYDTTKAVLSWDPIASQVGMHEVTFVVSDGEASDSEKITVEVRASSEGGGGAPLFITPSSHVLQLVQTDTIQAVVAVKDDDSARIDLRLEGAPEGLSFKLLSQDGKRGQFDWTPTREQISAQNIYSFRAVATDEAGNRSEQLIRVVIRLKDGGGPSPECPGEVPTVAHTPLRDQYGQGDYTLTATVTDDSRIVRVFAAFTTEDPQDLQSFQSAELLPVDGEEGGSEFAGTLPNEAAAAGETLTYYYYLCALDDDDETGEDCDHFWCIPEEAIFAFVAHPEDEQQGSCADDAREPDDEAAAARAVPTGTTPGLWLCPGDEDWLAVEAPAGATVRASILFAGARGDLDLELLSEDGASLDRSATDSDLEEVEATVGQAGRYLLQVTGAFAEGSDGNGYTLTLDVETPAVDCDEDPGEPNETVAQATPLEEGDSGPFTLCPNEVDVYSLTVPAGGEAELALRFEHASGDLDAALLDFGGEVLRVSETSDDDELLSFSTEEQTTIFLEVRGFRGASNSYGVELSFGEQAPCPDAAQEPNDRVADATRLGSEASGAVCSRGEGDDVDLYWLELEALVGLRVEASFDNALGDLDLVLFDSQGYVLAAAESSTDDELLLFPGIGTAGRLYLEVSGYQHAENTYSLTATAIAFADECLPDLMEPNEEVDDVRPIYVEDGVGELRALSSCGDVDLFAVDLEQPSSLLATATPVTEGADFELSLLSGDDLLSVSVAGEEEAFVEGEALAAGRYLLRVRDRAAASVLYTLTVVTEAE